MLASHGQLVGCTPQSSFSLCSNELIIDCWFNRPAPTIGFLVPHPSLQNRALRLPLAKRNQSCIESTFIPPSCSRVKWYTERLSVVLWYNATIVLSPYSTNWFKTSFCLRCLFMRVVGKYMNGMFLKFVYYASRLCLKRLLLKKHPKVTSACK